MISVRQLFKLFTLCVSGYLSAAVSAHEVTEDDRHAFEHKYQELCMAREKNSSLDTAQLRDYCECVAKEDSKRLTIDEVRKFNKENKFPVSLMMKSDAASSVCLPNQR